MDQQNQNPAPVAPPPVPVEKPATKTSWPALIGLVIVLLLVAGAAYYLKESMMGPVETGTAIEELETQGDSTDADAIEADLAAESPDEFEEDFDAAFAEIEASLGE